nr:RluA family pseudouridine synthase [Bacillota bacterium]
MQRLHIEVAAEEEGMMIRDVIRRRWPVSRGFIKTVKRQQQLWRNGRPAHMTERVAAGDRLTLGIPAAFPHYLLPEPMPLAVVFEDDWLMVVDKPPGVVVHPTKGHPSGTLANAIIHYWLSRGERPGFHLVQRLDRDTSGLLIVAKNAFSHQQLAKQMEDGRLEKQYLAVVQGTISSTEGVIEGAIWREPGDPRRQVDARGKPAKTAYQVVERLPDATLVRLRLWTGRTHQIRVHLSHIGHPIFGDALYGGDTTRIQRQALHAAELSFNHPVTRESMTFHSPLPEDMRQLIDALKAAPQP